MTTWLVVRVMMMMMMMVVLVVVVGRVRPAAAGGDRG